MLKIYQRICNNKFYHNYCLLPHYQSSLIYNYYQYYILLYNETIEFFNIKFFKLNMSESKKAFFNVYLSPKPIGLVKEYYTVLTPEAIQFLIDLNLHFQNKIDDLYTTRLERKCIQKKTHRIPKFLKTNYINDDWKIASVSKSIFIMLAMKSFN
jgi:hypothetical protein